MKPLRLLLQAFGPYISPVVIDFTPFDSAGIFLITGPTGGGKTSLLDAISFALFCKATGGHREFADMRCMRAPQDLPTLVELDFSLNEKSYRFRRSQFHKVNRRTKNIELHESHECFLLEEEGPVLLEHGSASAVTRQAEALLHLNYRQFAQVIVLPQGDFLRLLRANSKEKGEILRTLFSAQIWERLRERFHQREKALELEIRDTANMRDTLLRQEGADTVQALESSVKAQNNLAEQLAKEQEEGKKALAAADSLVKSAVEWDRLSKAASSAKFQLDQANIRAAQAQAAIPQAEEKRTQAERLQKEAVAAAQDQERLTGQLNALKSAQETEKKAGQIRKTQEAKQRELRLLQEQQKQLGERIASGLTYEKHCQEESARLPELMEKRQQLEKRLASLDELEKRRKEAEAGEKALQAGRSREKSCRLDAESLALRLAGQEEMLRRNAALGLAGSLREGEPCPVCGSIHHPSPAHQAGEGLLPPQELEALRSRERQARDQLAEATALAASYEEDLARAKARLEELGPQDQEKETRQAIEMACQKLKEQVEHARKMAGNLGKAREKLAVLTQEKESAAAQETAFRTEISGIEAQARELERLAKEARAALGGSDPQALEHSIREQEKKSRLCTQQAAHLREEAEGARQELAKAKEALALALESSEKASKALEAVQADWPQPPDLNTLERAAEELRERGLRVSRQLGEVHSRLRSQRAALGSVQELCRKLEELDQQFGRMARLSQGLSGNNLYHTPILQYALSVTLDEVLVSANQFFSRLSRGRYALRRVAGPKTGRSLGGLDIEVMDGASMLPRSIETLSGGEQFLASLSLAFGLSDVVQSHSGAVGLDSIFIDEGFGSLDGESLDQAMQALALLRTGGRMIGIISHVQELQNRIGNRIQVSQNAQGGARAQAVVL